MKIYFKTRQDRRDSPINGVHGDAGSTAPKGRRWFIEVPVLSVKERNEQAVQAKMQELKSKFPVKNENTKNRQKTKRSQYF